MIEALTEAVRNKARPFFGICVGMQLMATLIVTLPVPEIIR